MSKRAWIFPGQGSQCLGMGIDLKETSEGIKRFSQAEEILGWSILERCQGIEEELDKTKYTQPCLYVIESILVDLLKEKGLTCDYLAGHSLGEYVALYAAEVFDFETGLQLVKQRSRLMSEVSGGKMAALMKFNRTELEEILDKIPDVVLANDNSAEQVVISGTSEAIETVLGQVKAKRSMLLKVSGAFHSPMMKQASQEFSNILDLVTFQSARIPVLSNTDPTPSQESSVLKERLTKQMTSSVRWLEIMLEMPKLEISKVIEVGPGKVLTGLLKRTIPEIELKNIATLADL